jgi:exopolysaccharide production protein ExoZ
MAKQDTGGLPGIQILRGLAASLVLVHHVLEESQPLFGGSIPPSLVVFGASGVDLFFVISGFIMYHTNRNRFGRGGAPTDFFVRRLIRIVPLYWLCTLVIVLMHFGGLYANKLITWSSLGSSLLFLPDPNIVLGVGWTLNYEMYFYSIFAIWLLLGTTRSGIVGVLLSIPLMIIFSRLLPPGAMRGFLTDPIALEFGFGFALAVAFANGYLSPRIGRWGLLIGAAGLVLGTFFGPTIGTAGLAPEIRFLFWGVPATAVLIAALFVRGGQTRAGRILIMLGDASYSIYLTHAFVMTAYASVLKSYALPHVPRPVLMLVPIVVSLVAGLLTYRLIEHPTNEWLKVWWKKRSNAAAASYQSLPLVRPVEAADVAHTPEFGSGRVRP